MPQGAENLHAAGTGSVDPLLLAIVCVIFVVGAVVPIAAAILSSMRDDQAAKKAALTSSPALLALKKAANQSRLAPPLRAFRGSQRFVHSAGSGLCCS